MSISARLKEERQRLELSQTIFGRIGGVTKKTQMLYESGDRMPDAAYLRGIAGIGADVQYILIGLHSANLGEVMLSDEFVQETGREHQVIVAQRLASSPEALKPDEAALLDNYRHSPPEGQAAIKATSAAFAQPAKVKKGSKKAV